MINTLLRMLSQIVETVLRGVVFNFRKFLLGSVLLLSIYFYQYGIQPAYHQIFCGTTALAYCIGWWQMNSPSSTIPDDELFKQPPPAEDCPICMIPLPILLSGSKYKICCGKWICSGCIYAVGMIDIKEQKEQKCPFCRTPAPKTDEEVVRRVKKRMKVDDAVAIYNLACFYYDGDYGLAQDRAKTLELWHRAAELGNAKSYYSIGADYYEGNGVERDEKRANHYWELSAMGGLVNARHNLGCSDGRAGNMDRALKHFMIAAGSGFTPSLEQIKQMFMSGHATKDDYEKALQAYQAYLVEIKSAQRDQAAAAFDDAYKYY